MAANGASTAGPGSVLREGDTCWRRAHADRVSFIVDAADYFAAAKSAILQARRSVYLIGWEFDLSIRLRPGDEQPHVPDQLRRFLTHVTKEREDLEIFILQWDGAMMLNIARQLGPFVLLKARTKPQIHFRLDSRHPVGACHHQKIVVIDDALAFCGGIDMTAQRWDTHDHLPEDARRARKGTVPQSWHDMTVAVDGEAAKSLAELARWRWKRATGSDLPAAPANGDLWPAELPVDCRNVTVGIARTLPAYEEEEATLEIQRLWTKAIASARQTIYIENQFLTSRAIADALKARLRELEGPEVVIVLPHAAESWLESEVMDSARSLVMSELREADRFGRLGIYHPVNSAGEPIYVHAKVLIVDDSFVRVGSSNASNRSMCFDTESDLAIEAENEAVRATILDLRTKLVAEHLGTPATAFAAALQRAEGSVFAAIEALRGNAHPTLLPLEGKKLNPAEIAMVSSRMGDPEPDVKPSKRLRQYVRRTTRQNRVPLAMAGAALGGLAALGIGVRLQRSR